MVYVEPRMYVELYGPHFVQAFLQKNYEVTARARVRTLRHYIQVRYGLRGSNWPGFMELCRGNT
jgi:hypothetical protein